MGPSGYIHQAPSLADRAVSAARSFVVSRSFTPSVHPPFPELFGDPWTQHVNACTGFAFAKGAQVMARMVGIDIPELSAFAPYAYARLRRSKSLKDEGARTKDVAWAWNQVGACSEELWPSHSLSMIEQIRSVNELPSGSKRLACALNAAHWKRILPVKLTPIIALGARLEQLVQHALHSCRYLLVALPVGDEFDAGVGVIGTQRPKRGTHLVGILDWRIRGGSYEYLVGNSWGDWGINGRQWISSGQLRRATAAFYFESVG